MRDVFVSYSRGDQAFVELFVRSLQYVRLTRRRDSAPHAMAQKKLLELMAQGIDALG
jgi:hypothetical protein